MKKIFDLVIFSITIDALFTSCFLFPHSDVGTDVISNNISFLFVDSEGNALAKGIELSYWEPKDTLAQDCNYGEVSPKACDLQIEVSQPSKQYENEGFSNNNGLVEWINNSIDYRLCYDRSGALSICIGLKDVLCKRRVLSYIFTCSYIFGDDEEHEIKTYWNKTNLNEMGECYRIEFKGKSIEPTSSDGSNLFVIPVNRE